jgi:hypothetical protein
VLGPDLFCANAGDISIAFNKGGGRFHAARGYAAGTTPVLVSTADFDQNGTLDAVCVDIFQREIVFLSGAGDGSFERVGMLALGSSLSETPGYLVIEDLDGDGDLDLATTVYQTGEIQLVRNNGALPFTSVEESDRIAVGPRPTGIAAGDVNGDLVIDLAVASSDGLSVEILIGEGGGAFAAPVSLAVPHRPLAVLLQDLNADGHDDLVVTTGEFSGADANALVYRGDGAGAFELRSTLPLLGVSAKLAVGDFNGDGRPDLAASQSGQAVSEVFVLINQADFGFTSQAVFVGPDPGTLEIADVNRDGDLDLIVPLGIGELRLALGDGHGGFPTVMPLELGELPVPYGTSSVAYRDVDGDLLPDLLLVSGATPFLWVGRNISQPLAD